MTNRTKLLNIGATRASTKKSRGRTGAQTALITNYGMVKRMIRINEDWIVDVDEHNYILKRDMHIESVRKDGRHEHVYKVKGYFSSPQKALKAFGEEIVRDRLKAAEMGIADAVRTIQDTYEEWRRVVEEAMKEVEDD